MKFTISSYRLIFILALSVAMTMTGCAPETEAEKPELLFYIGITMVRPIQQLVEEFEEANNCTIKVVQGGSQDLYDSLEQSRSGDLYMPGSYSYRKENLAEGLLLDGRLVGYNRAALLVASGNPKGFDGSLDQLASADNKVVICNPESGSIGKETQKVLEAYGNYDEVFDNAVYLTTDSRNLNNALIDGDAEICINWYATSLWDDNSQYLEAIDIEGDYASKKMLILNLTSTSEYPELTRAFMDYASSDHGRQVFSDYGFLDSEDLESIDEVVFE